MKKTLFVLFAFFAFTACAPADGYKLVWADEFDGDGAPNPENWTYELMLKGQVNNEEQ